jgi:ATP-dependent DNA helicase DinG
VKGRSNYVSIRARAARARCGDALFDDAQKRELEAIVSHGSTDADGSLQDLAFEPAPKCGTRWPASRTSACARAARTSSSASTRRRGARRRGRDPGRQPSPAVQRHRRAAAAGNYGGTAVLPPYRRVVLDEAHNLEDAATSHLGVRVTRRGLHRLLARLERRGGRAAVLELRCARAPDLLQQDALRVVSRSLRRTRSGRAS